MSQEKLEKVAKKYGYSDIFYTPTNEEAKKLARQLTPEDLLILGQLQNYYALQLAEKDLQLEEQALNKIIIPIVRESSLNEEQEALLSQFMEGIAEECSVFLDDALSDFLSSEGYLEQLPVRFTKDKY